MTTNAVYFKRSLLRTTTKVEFRLNLGDTLASAQDVTKYAVNLGDLTEKLSKSSFAGGIVLPSVHLKFDNSRELWNRARGYFKDGYINGSEIIITTAYLDDVDIEITPKFVYRGIIKHTSCEWDRVNFIFEVTVTSPSSLLATEKISSGTLTNESFKETCFRILNRLPFTKYLTIDIDNFFMGWDVATINYGDMTNKKVKDVLDNIMLLTGSVYYVNYSGEFIIEPVIPALPSAAVTLRGDDIYSVNSEKYDWENHYTAIVWDDNENTVRRVEMGSIEKNNLQYDYSELTLDEKYVTNAVNRMTILTNLYNMHKYVKRKIDIDCKWNPEILVNRYIALDVPKESIIDDEFLVWNKDNWNEGKYWGFAQQGISFDSNELWRVVNIKRSTDGEKMSLDLVQLYSDDEV